MIYLVNAFSLNMLEMDCAVVRYIRVGKGIAAQIARDAEGDGHKEDE